jgi:hypothetical protein
MEQMSNHYLAELMGRVPTYTEATITLARGNVIRGIARDLPTGPGRRWTVEGWEWMIDADLLERVSVISVDINLPTIACIPV